MRQYRSPYSAVVTGAFDFRTEYIPPTALLLARLGRQQYGVEQTSIRNLCCDFKEEVILDVALGNVHGPICGGHLEEGNVRRVDAG